MQMLTIIALKLNRLSQIYLTNKIAFLRDYIDKSVIFADEKQY